jgi:transcriptional regulator with XRE-family HTH domain
VSYAAEHVIAALKAARGEKKLTQRGLSAKAGVPQSHISKIENGAVDIQLSSLIELARVLDLEVTLVPRRLVPAVQAILRSGEAAPSRQRENRQRAFADTLKHVQQIAKRLQSLPEGAEPLRRLQQAAVDLSKFPFGPVELREIQDVVESLQHIEQGPKALSDLRRAAKEFQRIRNDIAHSAPEQIQVPRPAYSLDAEDSDA